MRYLTMRFPTKLGPGELGLLLVVGLFGWLPIALASGLMVVRIFGPVAH